MNKIFFLIPLLLVISFGFQEVFAVEVQIAFDNSNSGRINDEADGSGCNLPTDFRSTGIIALRAAQAFEPFGDSCINGWSYFDLTSIPDFGTITNATLITDINESIGGKNCDVGELPNLPSSYTDDEIFTATENNKNAILDDWTGCQNDATGVVVNIPNAITPIQDSLATDDFFILTFARGDNGWEEQVTFTNLLLNVTYSLPADPPKQFFGDPNNWDGLDIQWLIGEQNDAAHFNYHVGRYQGDWDNTFNVTATNTFDGNPIDSNQTSWRIQDFGTNDEVGCFQYLMNGTLSTNLVGHWPLCGTTNDNGLLNNDGTVVGTELYYSDSDDNTSFNFNNVTDIQIPNESDYDWIDYNTAVSFTGVFQREDILETDYILSKNGGAGKFFLIQLNQIGKLVFDMQTVNNSDEVTPTTNIGDLDDGTPQHFAITKTTGSTCNDFTIYINGTVSPHTCPIDTLGSTLENNGALEFGATLGGGYFDGYVRDIGMWNTTLTSHQVDQLYNKYIDTKWKPFAITSLTASVIDFDSIRLDYTPPVTEWRATTCYQINFTTPLGDPQTVTENCISPAGAYFVDGLNTVDNNYSWRMGVTNPHGTNITSSLIANTTFFDPFVIGDIYVPSGDNPNNIPIAFIETDINATQTDIQVVYDVNYDLACNFSYEFGRTNTTYTGLTETPTVGNEVYTNFTLNDPDNEIITIYCYDTLNNSTDGTYLITQSSPMMPLLVQFQGFQDGLYGTEGNFGVLDIMTLFVVIIGMIGFNRYNPALGVIVMVMFMGAMSFFGFVKLESTIMGILALIVVVAVLQVRKT